MLRADASQREPYEVLPHQSLSFDVEKLLSKLLHHEVAFLGKQEVLRQAIARQDCGDYE